MHTTSVAPRQSRTTSGVRCSRDGTCDANEAAVVQGVAVVGAARVVRELLRYQRAEEVGPCKHVALPVVRQDVHVDRPQPEEDRGGDLTQRGTNTAALNTLARQRV